MVHWNLDVSKNRGKTLKMDGFIMENPQKKLGWFWGGKPPYFRETSKNGAKKSYRGCHRRKGIGIFVLEGGRDCTNPSRILAGNVRWIPMPCRNAHGIFFAQVERFAGFVVECGFPKRDGTKKWGCLKLKYNCIRIICHVENVHEPVQIWHYCCWNPWLHSVVNEDSSASIRISRFLIGSRW